MKNTCPIIGQIRLRDKIVAVDDEDVGEMTAMELGSLLGRKSRQAERKITVLREVGYGGVGGRRDDDGDRSGETLDNDAVSYLEDLSESSPCGAMYAVDSPERSSSARAIASLLASPSSTASSRKLSDVSYASESEIDLIMYQDLLRRNRLGEICDSLLATSTMVQSDSSVGASSTVSLAASSALYSIYEADIVDDDDNEHVPSTAASSQVSSLRDDFVDDDDKKMPPTAASLASSSEATFLHDDVIFDDEKVHSMTVLSSALSAASSEVSSMTSTDDTLPSLPDLTKNPSAVSDVSESQFIDIIAPPGSLGLKVDSLPGNRSVFVSEIKEDSAILDTIQLGDEIIAIDGEDVSHMNDLEISLLFASKVFQSARRSITVLRQYLEA